MSLSVCLTFVNLNVWVCWYQHALDLLNILHHFQGIGTSQIEAHQEVES